MHGQTSHYLSMCIYDLYGQNSAIVSENHRGPLEGVLLNDQVVSMNMFFLVLTADDRDKQMHFGKEKKFFYLQLIFPPR